MEIASHFSTPVMVHKVPDDLADSVEDHVVSNLHKLQVKDHQNHQHNDYSENESIVDLENNLTHLYNEILRCREEFERQTNVLSSKTIQYWIQDYRSSTAFHELHHHGVYGISGLYWVRANENAGPIHFKNPNTLIHYINTLHSENPSVFNSNYISYSPRKGYILMFPSWLEHKVLTGQDNIIRTTIAFNFEQNPFDTKR